MEDLSFFPDDIKYRIISFLDFSVRRRIDKYSLKQFNSNWYDSGPKIIGNDKKNIKKKEDIVKVKIKVKAKIKVEVKIHKQKQISPYSCYTPISDELCKFLYLPKGSQVSHTYVTKKISKYVKFYKLERPFDKRWFYLDKNLISLMYQSPDFHNREFGDTNYFDLQKYIKHHFIKFNEQNV